MASAEPPLAVAGGEGGWNQRGGPEEMSGDGAGEDAEQEMEEGEG